MKNRFHGVFSLFLIIVSIIVGLLSVLNESVVMGLWYIAIIFGSSGESVGKFEAISRFLNRSKRCNILF